MNMWDIVLGGLVLLIFVGAIRKMSKNKKSGKGCHGGCSGCSYDCHK